MLRRMFASSLLVAVSGGLLACGGAETSKDGATATMSSSLKGSVANPKSVPLGKSMHAAVVWHTASGFSVGENVAIQGTNGSFALDLADPPPASAFMPASNFKGASASWSATTKIAVATVVAYDDSNGNATLDLSPSGAAAADGIVASNSTQVLVYVDGPLSGTEASQGYNLVAYGSDCEGPTLLTAAGSATSSGPVTGSPPGDDTGGTLSTAPSSGPVTGAPPSGPPYLFPGLCAGGSSLTATTGSPSGVTTNGTSLTATTGSPSGVTTDGTSLTATTGSPSGVTTNGTSLTATTGSPSGATTGTATTGSPSGTGCGSWGTTNSPIVLTVAPYPVVPSSICGGVTQAP